MTDSSADIGQKLIAKMHRLIGELRNRRVLRTVGAYIALIWLLSQGFSDLFPIFGFPDWTLRVLVWVAVLAIPLVALLSWKYDITAKGLVPDQESPRHDTAGLVAGGETGSYEQRTVKSGSTDHFVEVSWCDANGNDRSQQFFHPFLIGRDADVDLRMQDPRVSRHHVRVGSLDGEWYIQDLNSSNGTFCDGSQIEMQDLEDRCKLRLAPDGPELDVALHHLGDRARSVEQDKAD